MKIIDENLLNEVSVQAKESPRLRMNYNFHRSLDEKCHRFLNAVEPGTVVPIHRIGILVRMRRLCYCEEE